VAARNFSAWVAIDQDSVPEGREVQRSAIVATANRKVMTTNTIEVPRYLNADVGGGSQLTEDTNDGDDVTLYSYQFNGKATIDQAESEDTVADEVEAYSYEWLNTFNISYDNASIGVSAARSSTVGDFRPYDSIYRRVRANDTGAGYTADTNYALVVASAGLTYTNLSAALGKVEKTKFWMPTNGVALLHPALLQTLRGVLDENSRPILVELAGAGTDPGMWAGRLMGYPAQLTFGAQVSNNFKMTAASNYLIAFVNRRYMRHGDRVAPQTRFIDASLNRDALEHTIQTRARKGFVLTIPQAASVLEVPASLAA
jgi:hypothetical protein